MKTSGFLKNFFYLAKFRVRRFTAFFFIFTRLARKTTMASKILVYLSTKLDIFNTEMKFLIQKKNKLIELFWFSNLTFERNINNNSKKFMVLIKIFIDSTL